MLSCSPIFLLRKNFFYAGTVICPRSLIYLSEKKLNIVDIHCKHTKNRLTTQHVIQGQKLCKRKIETLWRKNMRVEALLYMSLLVEYLVKEVIFHFERIVEGAAIDTQVAFNPRNIYSRTDLESQPLGYLINILDAYTVDKNLIKDLRHFSKVRNECIHKLFGQKISTVNKQLTGFYRFFYERLIRLLDLNLSQLAHRDKYFYTICDQCFEKELKKVKL